MGRDRRDLRGGARTLRARAADRPDLAAEARLTLDLLTYSIDTRGCPRDRLLSATPGGWQEDAHTDVVHNYVDALRAFPHWGDAL